MLSTHQPSEETDEHRDAKPGDDGGDRDGNSQRDGRARQADHRVHQVSELQRAHDVREDARAENEDTEHADGDSRGNKYHRHDERSPDHDERKAREDGNRVAGRRFAHRRRIVAMNETLEPS